MNGLASFGLSGATIGIVFIIVLILILGIIFVIYKAYHYIKDYPIRATIWTKRGNGFYPKEDKVGRFYNKKEGKEYCKVRGLNVKFANIPFDNILNDFNRYGKVNLLRSAHDEITPMEVDDGGLKPSVSSDKKFWLAQGIKEDATLFLKPTWLEKWGNLVAFVTAAIVIILLMIMLISVIEKAMGFGNQLAGATENEKLAYQYGLKASQINLLLYSLMNNVSLNLTNSTLFEGLNISEISFGERVIR